MTYVGLCASARMRTGGIYLREVDGWRKVIGHSLEVRQPRIKILTAEKCWQMSNRLDERYGLGNAPRTRGTAKRKNWNHAVLEMLR